MSKEIENRSDIEVLVNRFYTKVQADKVLAPLFIHVHWETHLPIMYNFWASLMFGDLSYRGNAFEKHLPLPLKADHFQQWLKLFQETVDENFEGAKAEEIKSRARSIADIFQHRMGIGFQAESN